MRPITKVRLIRRPKYLPLRSHRGLRSTASHYSPHRRRYLNLSKGA